MEKEQVRQMLEASHAILKGHYELTYGDHSDVYIHVRLALANESFAREVSKRISAKFANDKISVVVGFTSGGIMLAKYVADSLGVRATVARIENGDVLFVGGSEIRPGENVLLVDDVLRPPAGEGIQKVLTKIKMEKKGEVKGVAVVLDRSTKKPAFARKKKVKVESLLTMKLPVYPPDSCPLCRNNIPLENLSKVDDNPLLLLFSLPNEEDRVALATLLMHVAGAWKDKRLLEEINSFYDPDFELPGKKWERVAILGATESGGSWIMHDIAEFVAKLGFYAITSRIVYKRNTAERREIRHFEHEGMNDFLQRIIIGCQYAIIVYSGPGGQFIETVWCSQYGKPTLGFFMIKNLTPDSLNACEYLNRIGKKSLFTCGGYRATEQGNDDVGGWICDVSVRSKCPFLSQNIPKMIPEFFMNSKTMFFIGSDPSEGFEEPVRSFLVNKGILRLK